MTEKTHTHETNNVYEGKNHHHVTVNGKPLNMCHHIRRHSFDFAWGYTGSGPSQLALAICHHEELDASQVHYMDLKNDIIANFTGEGFTLTSQEIRDWIKTKPQEPNCNTTDIPF